jgi:hypothetical protein
MPFDPGFRLFSGDDLNAATTLSVSTGLVAAGTTAATGLQLVSEINAIGTATASTGVVLPPAGGMALGTIIYVFNGGASPVKVYSNDSTIDGTAGATGVTLTNAKRCMYFGSSLFGVG